MRHLMLCNFYGIGGVRNWSGRRYSLFKTHEGSLSACLIKWLKGTWGRSGIKNPDRRLKDIKVTGRWGDWRCNSATGDYDEWKHAHQVFSPLSLDLSWMALTLPRLSRRAPNTNLSWQGAVVLLLTASGGQPSLAGWFLFIFFFSWPKQGRSCLNTLLFIFAN